MRKANRKTAMKIALAAFVIATAILLAWRVIYAAGNGKTNQKISVKVSGKEKSGKTIKMKKGKKLL